MPHMQNHQPITPVNNPLLLIITFIIQQSEKALFEIITFFIQQSEKALFEIITFIKIYKNCIKFIKIYKNFIKELCTRIYEEQLAFIKFFAECLRFQFIQDILEDADTFISKDASRNMNLNKYLKETLTDDRNTRNTKIFNNLIEELDSKNIPNVMTEMYEFLEGINWISTIKQYFSCAEKHRKITQKDTTILNICQMHDFYRDLNRKFKVLKYFKDQMNGRKSSLKKNKIFWS